MPDFLALEQLNIHLAPGAREQLAAYHRLLLSHNARMDLTTVPEEQMTIRHYADSLLALNHGLIKPDDRVIDVGSGAGFPGLPLAIAWPGLEVTLLESRQKRCAFLREVVHQLGLTNVSVLCGRAEDLATRPHREGYDRALARAVAPLNQLVEYLLPYVRPGGQALCWKGPAVRDETAAGQAAARELGGRLGALVDLHVPGRRHFVQIIEKTRATPARYPRKAGLILRQPLG
ncbi:MAG: 16S rRNA (guanine(527)-N(7))-methyltransferase RsmG [Clostridiales bacterium]|nr:16S rRNA (guanine(527)-N(7))-methyltransferase RsmG [Clostridiales bacterium]